MSSSSKGKGKRSRSKKQDGIQTKKGGKLQPPKSRGNHKKSKSVDHHDIKSVKSPTPTLNAPTTKHERSKSSNMSKMKSTKTTKKSKSNDSKCVESKLEALPKEQQIFDCQPCGDRLYQKKMMKKKQKWKPFKNGNWSEVKSHFKKCHPKRKAHPSVLKLVGFIGENGHRYRVQRANDMVPFKCTYNPYFTV